MGEMNHDLHVEISRRLLTDYEFKEKGQWLRQGRCPSCAKKELYTHRDSPWVLKCGRVNNCGWTGHVKELFPEIFASWSDRYPASPTNPNEAADAYLKFARGLALIKLTGSYEQGAYYDSSLNIGSATVRFPLAAGGWWERLIDRPERFGKKKSVFKFGTDYIGTWWTPPGLDLSTQNEVWITEGIFNAAALREHGLNAVAAFTCYNYPDKALQELGKLLGDSKSRFTLVWAYDSDRAGKAGIRKCIEKARDAGWKCAAAQIPQPRRSKVDWNDLHQQERLEKKDLDQYRYLGALLIAETAHEKSLLIYKHTEQREFSFDFANRLYWFKLDLDRFNKARELMMESDEGRDLDSAEIRERALKESGAVVTIANCLPRALYYQANLVTDESWYYFRVDFPHDGPSVKNTFTGGQLASASEFKKRLMSMAAGAMWTGSSGQLDRFIDKQIYGIKTVETIDYIGYCREHGVYVFDKLAVKAGKLYTLNDEDYFDVDRLAIKSLLRQIPLALSEKPPEVWDTAWVGHLYAAFGHRGIIALAFWLGSLFAEQIRAKQKSFPFLEASGEPGTGKTTLIEFLWKLLGREHEGSDPSEATAAGRARTFVQVSNMPVVLMEGDRKEQDSTKSGRFDFESLRPLFNGRGIRARGVRNNGTDTNEPPFRASIVIEQNTMVNASAAMMSRIVHMTFDKSLHSEENKLHAEAIESWPIEAASHFMVRALQSEAEVLGIVETRALHYERMLRRDHGIREMRVSKCHGQMMALVEALQVILPAVTDDIILHAHMELPKMAVARQCALSEDHPIVQEFWEVFDYVNTDTRDGAPRLNHSRDHKVIAINLPHMYELAENKRQRLPPAAELKRHLISSKSRKYIGQDVVNSSIHFSTVDQSKGKSVRCWLFEKPKQSGGHDHE